MSDSLQSFLTKYSSSTDDDVLKKIWHGIENEDTILNLSKINIDNLSPIAEFYSLRVLYCNSTEIKDLSPIQNLLNLQELYCHSTKINDLSPISHLKELKILSCSETDVSELKPLENLNNLEILSCYSSLITDISPLKNLKKLKKLDISASKIEDISIISNLQELQILDCHNTKICDISSLKMLFKLQKINIHNTYVTNLSPILPFIKLGLKVKWSSISWERDGIYIENCPLITPPLEVAKQGEGAIMRWFNENERVGIRKVNEARLLILGQGGSGKTTLRLKLIDKFSQMPDPEMYTKGIEIDDIAFTSEDGREFLLHIWDFGGQNIQRFAHHFFLSENVVYVVLCNEREQNPNFHYWLNIIELLGKSSPVFIVQNEFIGKADPLKGVTQIQERFVNTFRSVEQVNLKNAHKDIRFEAIKLKLFHEISSLPHTQKEFPASLINVRAQLQSLSETTHSINYKFFKTICNNEGIRDNLLILDYANTLSDLGIILHFNDDIFLKAHVFLRPKWIVDALYELLYHPIIELKQGHFSEHDLNQIWGTDDYEGMHGPLLRLMSRFYICYNFKNSTNFIVPQKLPERISSFSPPENNTRILYRYKFIPSGILTQLTCILHNYITSNENNEERDDNTSGMVWSDAVQFSSLDKNGFVFVKEILNENLIEVNAFGNDKSEILNLTLDTLDKINSSSKLSNLKVEKLVPCPCSICIQKRNIPGEDGDYFDYEFLLELLNAGEEESDRCRLSRKKFPIRFILSNSAIRAYNLILIRNLIANDDLETALEHLNIALQNNDESLILSMQLKELERNYRINKISIQNYLESKMHIADSILQLIKKDS